jgi:1-deoxy-D-xylulose-5-phosphate reductoisomerase
MTTLPPVKVLLLGSTGSIGTSTIRCIGRFPDRFQITGLATNRSIDLFETQVRACTPAFLHIGDEEAADTFVHRRGDLVTGRRLYRGSGGLTRIVEEADYDVLVNALVGAVGLRPTAAALRRGKTVALANKESLVIGGSIINALCERHGGRILPLDSEHSAILQCLQGNDTDTVESLLITASGGPFRELPLQRFADITPGDALKHPTWQMGRKITIDSATLMNKGFEVIEAHFLFGFSYDRIRVVIHPQSIVHSMVEFHDGGIIAQMGVPDMELPIQYALTYPQRAPLPHKRLTMADMTSLTFSSPDMTRFPCLRMCIEAAQKSDACRIALNAANEVAITYFLEEHIAFPHIPQLIETACAHAPDTEVTDVDDVERIDHDIRRRCESEWIPHFIQQHSGSTQ